MKTDLEYGKKGRDKLKEGADKLANAVKVTLGPSGRNICIKMGDKYQTRISKDGVTIAENIFLENPIENIGCTIMKQAARNTVIEAGDGTTSATVLAQEIMRQGFSAVDNNSNPMEIRKGMNKAVTDIVEVLKSQSEPVNSDFNKIKAVATISANNDADLGEVIADAFSKVGYDGVLSVEENLKGSNTYSEVIDGFKVDSGINSHHFINNQKKQVQEFKNPYILVTDKRFEKINDLVQILGFMVAVKTAHPELSRPLVIVSDDIADEALKMLVQNMNDPNLPSFGMINAPAFGLERQLRLEDMSVILGGTYFSDENKYDLSVFEKANAKIQYINGEKQYSKEQRDYNISEVIKKTLTHFGKCDRIESNLATTLIVGGEGDKEGIDSRAKGLRKQIEASENDTATQMLKNRLAKLTCGIGVIKVGASTPSEYDEKCDLIDDAIRSTKAATEEGIAPGGGCTLLRISNTIKEDIKNFENADQQLGYSIVLSAIKRPFEQILENSGKEAKQIKEIAKKVLSGKGYNAKTEKYCKDMIKEGIIDPTKVIRVALESAVSMASTLLTTECVISGNLNEHYER